MNYDLFGDPIIENILLRDKFIEPPFSILDTRQEHWQNRKKKWRSIGIESEVGRKENLLSYSKMILEKGNFDGTSIFDPALCELIYSWFCPPGGFILDPFAGGSVRGIVANYLGYKYTGIDIRQEQVDSNRNQALDILNINNQPQWYVGDSNEILSLNWIKKEYDFIFSCPPYSNLEKYSDIPGDISNMEYDIFINIYESIIKKSISMLKKDSYACFVVSDIRDKKGFYRDFISHTKKIFIDSGAYLYNEAILLQPIGTAALRASKIFEAGKKLTKIHENVLIFKKQ